MKRVFIYSGRTLFSSGIKNLLDAEPELTVVGWATDLEEAVQQIHTIQPDSILIITKCLSDCHLSDGQQLLRAAGKARIVELNLENNNVCVYSGEQFRITDVEDLVRVI